MYDFFAMVTIQTAVLFKLQVGVDSKFFLNVTKLMLYYMLLHFKRQ